MHQDASRWANLIRIRKLSEVVCLATRTRTSLPSPSTSPSPSVLTHSLTHSLIHSLSPHQTDNGTHIAGWNVPPPLGQRDVSLCWPACTDQMHMRCRGPASTRWHCIPFRYPSNMSASLGNKPCRNLFNRQSPTAISDEYPAVATIS